MKVHVITDRLNSDRILPRMAQYLADHNGWSLSTEPDDTADFNYFNNYGTYMHSFKDWHETPMGAYFSHLDTTNKTKEKQWYEAAKVMDVCTITADMYSQFLPASKVFAVSPPVETNRFIIKDREVMQAKPVVGVSGFVYGDGRKGEHLWGALTNHPMARRLELSASGRGWAKVKTKYFSWKEIPDFYQHLDVLVCPSLFEGVPVPPLEALACGVKIVIPRGVGMLDDIPALAGVYRYKRGNAESMIAAVSLAANSGNVNRKALRQIVLDNYTVERWAEDHKQMIYNYFQVEQDNIETLPEWSGNSGVYLVAFGDPSRKCAKRCIESIKKTMPGLPIVLVGESPIAGADFIKQPDRDVGGREAKLKCDELAPADWKYVLYLDADTEVVKDISFLFKILQDGWEMVIAKDNVRFGLVSEMSRPDNEDECLETWGMMGSKELLQYNGGVIAYRRNERTRQFWQDWRSEWNRYGKRDQGALLRALYKNPLRVFVLLNQWNASTRYQLPKGEIAIKHHNIDARRWSGLIKGRLDGGEAWAAVSQ